MKQIIRRNLWTINLITIALCSMFAAKGAGWMALSKIPLAFEKTTSLSNAYMPFTRQKVSPIVSRNIFCSTCKIVDEKKVPNAEKNGDITPANKDYALIATLTHPQDPRLNFALIKDKSDQEIDLFNLQSKLPNGALITDISANKIMINIEGRLEYLDLDNNDNPTPSPPRGQTKRPRRTRRIRHPARAAMKDFAQGVRKIGAHKWEIQRKALNKVLSNTVLIARSARIVPSMKNGKPNGFKLLRVRRGRFYSIIGMQSGDIIQAIDGHKITTPDKALEVYTKLRSARYVSISFSRRGNTITHEYIIR